MQNLASDQPIVLKTEQIGNVPVCKVLQSGKIFVKNRNENLEWSWANKGGRRKNGVDIRGAQIVGSHVDFHETLNDTRPLSANT